MWTKRYARARAKARNYASSGSDNLQQLMPKQFNACQNLGELKRALWNKRRR